MCHNACMSTATTNIGLNVRILLLQKGKQQSALATAMGITPASLSRKLTGHRPISVDELSAFAEFLDVPAGLLMEDPGSLVRNRWFLEPALTALAS